jgi:c-di-GMP-binding flagellar brake protein YcgR
MIEKDKSESRKEARLPIEVGTTIEVGNNGQLYRAATVDMSASGVLLEFDEADSMAVGDLVTCDFIVNHNDDQALPYWGIGNVVRVEGKYVAIRLNATGLVQLETSSAPAEGLTPATP